MKVLLLSLFFACFITACASTGIIPIGKDTYMVSKQSATGYQSAVGIKGVTAEPKLHVYGRFESA